MCTEYALEQTIVRFKEPVDSDHIVYITNSSNEENYSSLDTTDSNLILLW